MQNEVTNQQRSVYRPPQHRAAAADYYHSPRHYDPPEPVRHHHQRRDYYRNERQQPSWENRPESIEFDATWAELQPRDEKLEKELFAGVLSGLIN